MAAPVEAKGNKKGLYALQAHPTNSQAILFDTACCSDPSRSSDTGAVFGNFKALYEELTECERKKDFNYTIVDGNAFLSVAAEVFVWRHSREFYVLLSVENVKQDWPVKVLPQKVFLVDPKGSVHLAVLDFEAKATVAAEHRLPPFAPPPPQTYYTITQVPISRQPAGPTQVYAIQDIGTGYLLYGTQPQITTYQNIVTPNQDWSSTVGYEIGYALGMWINRRSAKKQIEWIDKNWLHPKELAPEQFDTGYLMFDNVLQAPLQPPKTPKSPTDWVDWTPPSLDGPVKLVIFVGDQQFVLEFGPELVEAGLSK